MDAPSILLVARELITFLRSFDGEDQGRGQEAALIIERTLESFATRPEAARSRLSYDVGGKGMLDWGWTQEHRTGLEARSDALFRLLAATTREAV